MYPDISIKGDPLPNSVEMTGAGEPAIIGVLFKAVKTSRVRTTYLTHRS